jgi:hypothetical protein
MALVDASPAFYGAFFPTPEILILVKVFYFRCVLFLILILSSVAAMAAGRKDQESDGWASRFEAPYSGIYSSDRFLEAKKKTGTNVHKDAIFNSYSIGCIPISSWLFNALAAADFC